MGLCVSYYVEYSSYNVKKSGIFLSGLELHFKFGRVQNWSFGKGLMKMKVVPKLLHEVKVDIVTSDDIKIHYTGKFQDFTVRYITKHFFLCKHFQFGPYHI